MLSAPTAAPERSPRLLAAITLFVLFDLLVLAVNFWITWQVEHDALAINVARRQRMLTQRIAKSLLLLGRPEDATQARRDLRAAISLSALATSRVMRARSASKSINPAKGMTTSA